MMDEGTGEVWDMDSNPSNTAMSEVGNDDDSGDGDYVHGNNEDISDCSDEDESHPLDGDGPKAGWSEDTVQTEAMARLGLCVNTAARVVVCLDCASAVQPSELARHFSKVHPPMSTTASYCEELLKTYDLRPEVDS